VRHHRNYITSLYHDGSTHITHEAKEAALEDFFGKQLGSKPQRQHTLNWDLLQLARFDLQDLDKDISEEEIHGAIKETASEKAPGPDGYIGGFFKVCWDIVKVDVVNAIKEIFALRLGSWNLLNSTNVVLIKKKEGAATIGDYRPISIMRSIAKVLAKIMANRLASHLDRLVSHR
jgi:hypothetical protein